MYVWPPLCVYGIASLRVRLCVYIFVSLGVPLVLIGYCVVALYSTIGSLALD